MTTPYHHGNLRQAAIDEAVAMLEAMGAEQVTLRNLAKRLGVTHRALYRHFSDRTTLLSEAACRTIEVLQAALTAAADSAPATARTRFEAALDAYIRFALEKPEAYRHATHAGFAKSDASAELHRVARSLGACFGGLLAGLKGPTKSHDDAIALWGQLHGLIDLYLGGSLRARSREVARQYIRDLVLARL